MRVLVLLLAFAGCSHETPPPQQPVASTNPSPAVAEQPKADDDGTAEAFASMKMYRDKLCACREHDSQCAQQVTDDMTKWAQGMSKKYGDKKPRGITPEREKEMSVIAKQMGDCAMKAMMPEGGNPCGGGGDPCSP
jgi:hypothetical protein